MSAPREGLLVQRIIWAEQDIEKMKSKIAWAERRIEESEEEISSIRRELHQVRTGTLVA